MKKNPQLKKNRTAKVPNTKAPNDKFKKLERRAFERSKLGLALPKEIYDVPYRDRVDWFKFPEWARPSDPELYRESGHEG